jgi:pyrroloquinoline quinone (PQQ) biosynthesis protein C
MTETVEQVVGRLEAAFMRIEKAHNELGVRHAKEKLELVSDLEMAITKNRELEDKIETTKYKLDSVISRLNTMLEAENQEDAA